MEISFDKKSLIIDGKRTFIKSGAFHYFRTPGAELALERFSKLKAAGYNAVDIYFNWNYHSQKPHEYDFTGIKDVRKVLEAAKKVGLFIIARPGPFINAEINAGGIPFWVLADKDVIPRNRIGTSYHYSKKYMEYLTEWYDQIVPIITEFNNVILFQIENEYATDEMDEEYMRELYKMARDRGITCPIFHNDAYTAGLWADVVDIYATDLYPYINATQNWRQDTFCFDTLDNVEDSFRMFKETSPIFIAELQSGWFDKWDGLGYKHMRDALGDEHINIMTKTAISQGCTLFNHYMAIGGTSWDDLACDEVYTSYDFTAPIDEFGIPQSNLYKAKELNYFLNSFSFTDTEPLEFSLSGENLYARLRKDNENNCEWLFLRNLNKEALKVVLPTDREVTLKPFDIKICPQNLELLACKIDFSDVEIFARLKNDEKEVLFMLADTDATLTVDGKNISGEQHDYANFKFERDGKTTEFVFLTKELADRTWIVDNKVVFNTDWVYSKGIIAIPKTTEVAYFDLEHGFSKKYFTVKESAKELPLSDWSVSFCAPEIDPNYDYSNWAKVQGSTDLLSCGLHDEFVFYKAKIPNIIKEITLSARHLFAVYVNGKEVLSRNSYKLERLQEVPETLEIPLNTSILNKKENELTILVQNIGFDKGFSGDTNYPRGLVTFKTIPQVEVEFFVCEELSVQRGNFRESENPYLTRLSATFKHEFKENVVAPLYLLLKDVDFRRATILLNGVKVGRYIKRQHVQDKFYLPETFLKPENTLDIILWTKDRNIKSKWDFKSDAKNVIIKVGEQIREQLV